jgi:hypothetical protein
MSIDKDQELASKVDALLKRHAAEPAPADDRNIPVLSEIVRAPDWKPAPGNSALPAVLSEEEQKQLAHDVFVRVFEKLDGELSLKIESRLTERLAAQVSAALDHAISDLRQDIANGIGDAINEALNDALSRRKSK